MNQNHEGLWEKIAADPAVRRKATRQNLFLFFLVYFYSRLPADLRYAPAPFHKEIFRLLQDSRIETIVIEAFRGSGKTTIISQLYPIWSIVGQPQKKFVLLLAQTQDQARQYLTNIKKKLEEQSLLREDMGPFEEPDDEWRSMAIVIPKYGARIAVASIDKPVRGLIHGSYRPDLIIVDDLEDLDTVQSQERRDKIYNWLIGDVFPLGDTNTRRVIIGTRLHNDSLLMRLRKDIEEKRLRGIVRSYPLIDAGGLIMWPGKFPTQADIDKLRSGVPTETAWQREYMLKVIAEEDQVVRQEWIHYYDALPPRNLSSFRYSVIAVDPASSKDMNADYTGIVCADIHGSGENLKIYILPHLVNKKLSSNEIIEEVRSLRAAIDENQPIKIWVEEVSAQAYLLDNFRNKGFSPEGIRPLGDKRERLKIAAGPMQATQVFFPKLHADKLITQLLSFGAEKHDDLVDAFSMLINKVISESMNTVVVLPPYELPQAPPLSKEEAEKKADQEAIAREPRERERTDIAYRLEKEYELRIFRRMMGMW